MWEGSVSEQNLAVSNAPDRVPAELANEAASTRDGRDITRPFTFEIEEYRDQRLQRRRRLGRL
jgi:hypothetical protein